MIPMDCLCEIKLKFSLIIPFCILAVHLCAAQDSSGFQPVRKDSAVKIISFPKFLPGAAESNPFSESQLNLFEYGSRLSPYMPWQEAAVSKLPYLESFKKSLSLELSYQSKEYFKYDLGEVGYWLGLAKTYFAIILAILSL